MDTVQAIAPGLMFQHTAARRRLGQPSAEENAFTEGFNTQPPEGGWASLRLKKTHLRRVSTHSRPKAAGITAWLVSPTLGKFQHTAARRRLGIIHSSTNNKRRFQHTAARRRLGGRMNAPPKWSACFNTQPPEGGWPTGGISPLLR